MDRHNAHCVRSPKVPDRKYLKEKDNSYGDTKRLMRSKKEDNNKNNM
jgi:hypothetical protein